MNFFKNLLSKKKSQPQPSDYILYYRKLCHDCDKVKLFLEDNEIAFDYVDCEAAESKPPVPIMATPALFKQDELMAYGIDIIHYIKKS